MSYAAYAWVRRLRLAEDDARSPVCGKAKLVLHWLAHYADEHGYCFPSVRLLAERSQLNKDTVCAALEALEAGGYLTKSRARRGPGNAYQLALGRQPEVEVNLRHRAAAPKSECVDPVEPVGKSEPVDRVEKSCRPGRKMAPTRSSQSDQTSRTVRNQERRRHARVGVGQSLARDPRPTIGEGGVSSTGVTRLQRRGQLVNGLPAKRVGYRWTGRGPEGQVTPRAAAPAQPASPAAAPSTAPPPDGAALLATLGTLCTQLAAWRQQTAAAPEPLVTAVLAATLGAVNAQVQSWQAEIPAAPPAATDTPAVEAADLAVASAETVATPGRRPIATSAQSTGWRPPAEPVAGQVRRHLAEVPEPRIATGGGAPAREELEVVR